MSNAVSECIVSETKPVSQSTQLKVKINEFQVAMERYHANVIYKKLGIVVAIIVIGLQILTVLQCLGSYPQLPVITLLVVFVVAYILTDFINGLVHLVMDNNTHYNSFLGPLIAAFHLHHITPRYTKKHPVTIYFYETGSKIWLIFYLGVLTWLQRTDALPLELNFCLVCIGILSSLAELSHYWCHNTNNNKLITLLQNCGVLLSKKHHRLHHTADNTHYAFLNGISDPLINRIAHYYYAGYKSHADLHAKAYQGPQTGNRP